MSTAATRASVAEAARRLAAEGLLIGTAGNVSARLDDRVAVTATGVELRNCTLDEVTVVSLDGAVVEGRLLPTSEVELHLGVYADTSAAAVVHTHAPWSTAVACVLDELPATTSVDILAPGDPDLLAWIADALPHTDYLLPNDEQVLGFTGATSLADGARELVGAGRRVRGGHPGRAGRTRGDVSGRGRGGGVRRRGRRHHRLR